MNTQKALETTITNPTLDTVVGKRRIPRTFAALGNRNYMLFFLGMLVSSAGTWMQIIAQGWLVYELTRSEWALGVVGFAAAIPAMLVSPWGGVLVDRISKRKILLATQLFAMVLAFILAGLVLTDVVEVWHVIVLAALTGMVNSIDAPARQALTPDLVSDRSELPNAIALNAMIFNGARVVGPAFGGILLVTVGAGWCFFFNGVSFLAVIISLLLMDLPETEKRTDKISPLAEMKSGAAYIRRDKTILGIVTLSTILCLFGVSYATVLPAYADKVLQGGESAYANLTALQGIGAVVGAVLLATYANQVRRGWVVTAATIYFPLVLIGLAFTTNYPVALGLMFILGLGFISLFNQLNVILQLHVDNAMRGRVMSLYTLTFFGISPFGNLLIGAWSEWWGLTTALGVSGAITLAGALLVHHFVPEIRRV
jgi:MFS family permease